jgi:Variant SH3 domain
MFQDQVRAVRGHEVPGRAPLRVAAGQRVTAEQRDSPWPAFVFVTAEDGEGWVPARFLDRSSGPATVLVPYDTTELATTAGEILTVVTRDAESGWIWARAANGREGWVPDDTVREVR